MCFYGGLSLEYISINMPLTDEIVMSLRVGQNVLLNGKIYSGRDSTHERFFAEINKGRLNEFDWVGQVVYYAGPSPARKGRVIGACGPTTSSRMDVYLTRLLERGLKGTIGKGSRSQEVIKAMMKYKAVYFAAVGGIAALTNKCIQEARVIAFQDLGPEAMYELVVKDFPLIVANDVYGGDIYEEGIRKYAVE